MSGGSPEKSKKKRRKSLADEREEKGSKVKKRRTPAATVNSQDFCGGLQRSESRRVILELEPTIDSTLTQTDRDEQPLASSCTPLETLGKVKVSRKRKRAVHSATLDTSVDSETAATESRPSKKKRRDESPQQNKASYPDPAIDEALSEQSRKALLYAYEWCKGVESWKFNKARQNWLLRNVCSECAVPEGYLSLVIEYLAGIRGGARKKLIDECGLKMSTSEVMQGTRPPVSDGGDGVPTLSPQSRAFRILHALRRTLTETTA